MTDFFNENWIPILKKHNLSSFDHLWDLELTTFDEPNTERGGWSSVCKLELPNEKTVFIKRQSNHCSKTMLHPIKGIPTFTKEFKNIQRYCKKGIPTLTPIYSASRMKNGEQRAILITLALDDHDPLSELSINWKKIPLIKRRDIIREIAIIIRRLHNNGLQHNCLYPKHIFVKHSEERPDIRLIDLEKSRYHPIEKQRVMRDLDSLYRHTNELSHSEILFFVMQYLGVRKLDDSNKKFCKQLLSKAKKKST